jgi:hypothetical protein
MCDDAKQRIDNGMTHRLHLRCTLVGLILGGGFTAFAQEEPPQAPDRIFGVLANYTTVEDPNAVTPITTKARFRMAALNSFDPYVFPFRRGGRRRREGRDSRQIVGRVIVTG